MVRAFPCPQQRLDRLKVLPNGTAGVQVGQLLPKESVGQI